MLPSKFPGRPHSHWLHNDQIMEYFPHQLTKIWVLNRLYRYAMALNALMVAGEGELDSAAIMKVVQRMSEV